MTTKAQPKRQTRPDAILFRPGDLKDWLFHFAERNGFKNVQEAIRDILRTRKLQEPKG